MSVWRWKFSKVSSLLNSLHQTTLVLLSENLQLPQQLLITPFAIQRDKIQLNCQRSPSSVGCRGRGSRRGSSVLRCVAVCCGVLQCVAVCCSVLQCVAVSGIRDDNTLQYTTTHCKTLQDTARHCCHRCSGSSSWWCCDRE